VRMPKARGKEVVDRTQIHVWVTASDYRWLRDIAAAQTESVSSVVRRLVRLARLQGLHNQNRGDGRAQEPCSANATSLRKPADSL
jgi:hypothetical protein